MNYLNGGYSIIKKGDANIYASLEKALTNGKPILFYEDDNTCYYIDTISKSGDDIILTKGGKTITITDANVVTETGDINSAILEKIIDESERLRFIEGDGTPNTTTGVTITYAKWSLSGTHLMIVVAGSVADTTVLDSNNRPSVRFALPKWVRDKIYPVFSDYLELRTIPMTASDWTTQNVTFICKKNVNDIEVAQNGNVTLTKDRAFRIQFDLLIDQE